VPIRPSFLSGASSGALSVVALNAIIQSEDMNVSAFTWSDYKEIIFSLYSGKVFDDSVEGLAKIFSYNIYEGYFLDNSPLESLLKKLLDKMGYKTMGDLYIPTCITVVNQSSGLDLRLWSTDSKYKNLDLLQVLMASTALPMAFTPRTIDGFGDTLFIDGGTGIDTIPVYSLLNDVNVSTIYIICYGGAITSGGGTLPSYLDYIKLLKNGLATIDDMRVDLFEGAIEMCQEGSNGCYLYMPNLNQSFSALDFDYEKLEYSLAMQWATLNNPTHLKKYNISDISIKN